jgi:hypothetical protein
MKFGPSNKHNFSGDNVLTMHADLYVVSEVDTVAEKHDSNVVAIHSGPVIGVVAGASTLDEVTVITESLTDSSAERAGDDADGASRSCVNGVCSINWKPKRPTAA